MKIYAVKEQYTFESVTESRVTLFSTKEKALRKFSAVVDHEKNHTWINELSGVIEDVCDYEKGEYYAYLDGRSSEYCTEVTISEQEVY